MMLYKSNDPVVDGILVTVMYIHVLTTILAKIISFFRTKITPIVYDAVKIKNWPLTLRLLSDPHKHVHAKYTTDSSENDEDPFTTFHRGYNALHRAADGPDTPSEVVIALLHAFRDAAVVVDSKGCTPLHYAARYASDKVVSIILKAYPGAASVLDETGASPLLNAVRSDRSREVIQNILAADPGMVVRGDKKGSTPWRSFFEVWEFKMMTLTLFDDVPTGFVLGLPVTYRNGARGCVGDIYELVCEFLRVVTGGDDKRTMMVVHECVKLDCPTAFFHLLLRVHPEQTWMEDDTGMLLVHSVAVGKYGSKRFTKMMEYLLQINPLASAIPIPSKNRLLLNTVIEQGIFNYETIFLAAPDAIQTRDVINHMTTFMTAATVDKKKGGPLKRFTKVFDLLMKDPTLVSYGIRE